MSNANTGGPAFPFEYFDNQLQKIKVVRGMSLRDYFAAKAMQALIIANGPTPNGGWPTYAERTAYTIADAMLRARES